MSVVVSNVTLPFLNDALALRVYTCTEEEVHRWPAPVIVLCHGFAEVQEMLLPAVACSFAQEGFVVVTFDYRGFGDSGGERGRLTVANQQEDIRVVLRWVRNNPILDERRIGLWGTGLGGGHVLCVAARNPQVRCVVSQMPVLDGRELITRGMALGERANFLQGLAEREARCRIDGKELWVPVNRLIQDRASLQFFHQQRRACPAMCNRMPYLTLHELCHLQVQPYAGAVAQPTLIVLAGQDHLMPDGQMRAMYEALGGVKSLFTVLGAGHYDLYRTPWRDEALQAQRAWFQAYL
ncbi:alpha/beta hydrolase [Serratia ureilytica]|uniref:alpha/beta hydrolase n=1 Tax=Serratia ureilytica TaxID=300181 RepID=UPI0018D5D25E|nr:alpha/beta fold hydrolase [Serratia ureilytica]MBH3008172.1 alpha/beta fold hydrolase [Serratia ureilytica]MBH3022814.1 alpha/beta fold hydrolase [Serratia ureilytica]MBH3108693.1 alpha/beta fold hydrolase [Serratia ureilytica]MBH3176087.1 alpha/beta fold hydrolase [Serratia ureilytica]QQU62263.1 alpha/beta fold hydrolase [Serratia ureilytica]